jgi:hypothetical protein
MKLIVGNILLTKIGIAKCRNLILKAFLGTTNKIKIFLKIDTALIEMNLRILTLLVIVVLNYSLALYAINLISKTKKL